MRTNTANQPTGLITHEGASAKRISPIQQLRRSVMSCLLWESEFYEDGEKIGKRIAELVHAIKDKKAVADLAIEAREEMNLRHVPLLIVREMARSSCFLPSNHQHVAYALERVIQRADELTEFLSLYWKDGRQPLSGQVKKGLAAAFRKFSAYQLAKYNRDAPVKLRDVLFLCHAKPKDEEQAVTWKKLIDGTLEPPDTWEVALSGGANKKETFERLMREKKLGALALLRNLRNMLDAGVSKKDIANALMSANLQRVLPFRFIAAAVHAPRLEPELESALFASLGDVHLGGRTVVLVDVSGSMTATLSYRSKMRRIDAACGVAMIARQICEYVRIFAFSASLAEIAPRQGFALRDAIINSMPNGCTYLGQSVSYINQKCDYDRFIVITDEQSHDEVGGPKQGKGYMLNVASNKNGVGYRRWTHIDGWSDAVIRYIAEIERETKGDRR